MTPACDLCGCQRPDDEVPCLVCNRAACRGYAGDEQVCGLCRDIEQERWD